MTPHPTRCAVLFTLVLAATALRAADSSAGFSYAENDNVVAAVRAADDERVAASMAVDRARLDAIFSAELHYAHSNGHVDTKDSYVESIMTGKSVYEGFDYKERTFLPAGPGIVLMTGHAIVHSRNADGPNLIDLNFLAVWREEHGKWRFLAWQSCRNPPATPAATPPPAPPAAPTATSVN